MRTSVGGVCTVLPTAGLARSRNACACAAPAPAHPSTPARARPDRVRWVTASPREDRPPDRVREQVVEIEMQLKQRADAVALALPIGNDRLGADLIILPGPDHAGRHHPGRRL